MRMLVRANPVNLTTEREAATVTLSQAHHAYDSALWDYQYEEMVTSVILKRLPGLRLIEERAVLALWTDKDAIRHANEKPMTAPPSKVPRMAIASRSLERYDGRIVRRLAHLAKEEVDDIYKDYTSDQLQKVVDEYFENTEKELMKKLDDAAATMKAAQEAHSKELGRCYALAQYLKKEARALRRRPPLLFPAALHLLMLILSTPLLLLQCQSSSLLLLMLRSLPKSVPCSRCSPRSEPICLKTRSRTNYLRYLFVTE
ncbi:unnamed protein product, partial [Mesorhabditis spiculigera]